MSYKTYAENEFRLNSEYDDVKDIIIDILTVPEKEGHSGGSMGAFSGAFEHWAKNPKEPEKDSLLYPYWEKLKDMSSEQAIRIAKAVSKLQTFTPLSPLTGEDDEWVVHDYGHGPYAQNRRISSIFKDSDGSCYRIDGRVFQYPSHGYRWWLGYTSGKASCVDVTFPYDPDTPIEYVYYVNDPEDDKDRIPLGEGIDPKVWLQERYDRYMLGLDAETGDLRPDCWYIKDQEEAEAVLRAYKDFKALDLDEKNKDRLQWFIMDAYDSVATPPTFRITSSDDETLHSFQFVTFDQLRSFARLVHSSLVDERFDPHLVTVYKPTKHYQDWEQSGFAVTMATSFSKTLYVDENKSVATSDFVASKYLYDKCKEKGLEYKGRKDKYWAAPTQSFVSKMPFISIKK